MGKVCLDISFSYLSLIFSRTGKVLFFFYKVVDNLRFVFNTSIDNFDLHNYLLGVPFDVESDDKIIVEQIKQNIIEFVSDCIISFVVGELNQNTSNTKILVDFEA